MKQYVRTVGVEYVGHRHIAFNEPDPAKNCARPVNVIEDTLDEIAFDNSCVPEIAPNKRSQLETGAIDRTPAKVAIFEFSTQNGARSTSRSATGRDEPDSR